MAGAGDGEAAGLLLVDIRSSFPPPSGCFVSATEISLAVGFAPPGELDREFAASTDAAGSGAGEAAGDEDRSGCAAVSASQGGSGIARIESGEGRAVVGWWYALPPPPLPLLMGRGRAVAGRGLQAAGGWGCARVAPSVGVGEADVPAGERAVCGLLRLRGRLPARSSSPSPRGSSRLADVSRRGNVVAGEAARLSSGGGGGGGGVMDGVAGGVVREAVIGEAATGGVGRGLRTAGRTTEGGAAAVSVGGKTPPLLRTDGGGAPGEVAVSEMAPLHAAEAAATSDTSPGAVDAWGRPGDEAALGGFEWGW